MHLAASKGHGPICKYLYQRGTVALHFSIISFFTSGARICQRGLVGLVDLSYVFQALVYFSPSFSQSYSRYRR